MALTAALAHGQKFNFGAFMSLESQEVDNFGEIPHAEPANLFEEEDEN